MPCVGRGGEIVVVPRRIQFLHFRIAHEIRAHENSVLRLPHAIRLQAVLELRDFPGLVVAEKPVVRISAVIPVEHDLHVVVNRSSVLQGFPRAHKFRLAVRVPAFEA